MSSKTKIIVLHMKEVVYTILFLILAILFGVLLFFMFGSGKNQAQSGKASKYTPGIYRSSISLNGNTFDMEVSLDADRIASIDLVNLSESTKAAFPLMNLPWNPWPRRSISLNPWRILPIRMIRNIPVSCFYHP